MKVLDCTYTSPDMPPDGTYRGTWGGYLVRVPYGLGEFHLKMSQGIRTPNAPVKVVVEGVDIRVELEKREG